MSKQKKGKVPFINESLFKIMTILDPKNGKTTRMIHLETGIGKGTTDEGKQTILAHCNKLRKMGFLDKKLGRDHLNREFPMWILTKKGVKIKETLLAFEKIVKE